MGWQRIRTIKPGFFVNEELGALSPLARLLFIGLWTVADREGRLEDRPARLKVTLLPYDDVDVEGLLTELLGRQVIHRYEIEGRHYIQVVNFALQQRPNCREPASTYPAPHETHARTCMHMQTHADTLGREKEEKRKRESNTGLSPSESGFSEFWIAYPKKRHKPAARVAWRRIEGDANLSAILVGLEAWKASDPWARGFVEDPATFLRQRQWEDRPMAKPLDPEAQRTQAFLAEIRAAEGKTA